MFISHLYKVIFIHIQRTGGNSIQKIFETHDPDLITKIAFDPSKKRVKHAVASDLQTVVEPALFNAYRKFCVVRNPFDRIVSWYSMFKYPETIETVTFSQNPELWQLGQDVYLEISQYVESFEQFLRVPRDHVSGLFERFYLNQLEYISAENHILIDRILRFEHLPEDFADFASEIGFEGQLPHTNKSIREGSYRAYYNEYTQAIVAQRFQRDLDYFGYTF